MYETAVLSMPGRQVVLLQPTPGQIVFDAVIVSVIIVLLVIASVTIGLIQVIPGACAFIVAHHLLAML